MLRPPPLLPLPLQQDAFADDTVRMIKQLRAANPQIQVPWDGWLVNGWVSGGGGDGVGWGGAVGVGGLTMIWPCAGEGTLQPPGSALRAIRTWPEFRAGFPPNPKPPIV